MTKLFERILLVEDDPGHALIIQRVLKELASSVSHTANLLETNRILSKESFDLIITDLHLPDGNETKIIESIIQRAADVPLLVLTSSTSLSVAVAAMRLGAKDYIVKNFGSDFKDVLTLAVQKTAHASQLEKERKRLQTEMAVLRIAIENSRDALVLLGANGSVAYANSAFQEIIGSWNGSASHAEKFFNDSIIQNDLLTEGLLQRLTGNKGNGFWSTEFTVKADGERKSVPSYYRVELASIFGDAQAESESQTQWALWLRDITEAKQREKFQREILSTTTHDLKGPLGAIILSAEMISSNAEKSDRVKELAIRTGSAAQGAVNIIDEFLSARRIQEGTFILKPSQHSVGDLLEEVVDGYHTMAAAKSIKLAKSLDDPNLSAIFDRLSLVRVLGNLVTNALKFTPKGGTVTLSAALQGDFVLLSVRDTGQGMEASEIQKLFERFSRLAKHADISGTGLGLFVVKCIIEAHGGSITVSSEIGKGSVFEILLPLSPPTNQSGELVSLAFL